MPHPTAPPVPRPADDPERVAAVRATGLLGAGPDGALDGLVRLAAQLCGTSSAEINLIDEDTLWFCAARGMGHAGASVDRELTFCTWTILDRDRPLLVPDARRDERFATNPFVHDGIVGSYAGMPLLVDGHAVGTMCVHDPVPRSLDATQLDALRTLASAAQAHIALRRHAELLEEQARTDPLTGAANRRAIDEALAAELSRARRHGCTPAVLMLDLDRFKDFNDAHGHLAGDLLLQRAAAAWRGELRGCDLLGRWGGEEFCVLLDDCTAEGARAVAERLRAAVPDDVTCSVGAATWDGEEDGEGLVARADLALYDAKKRGRDRVVAAG